MKNPRTFETVCAYAETRYPRRQGESKAKDISKTYFLNPWTADNVQYMVLFETEKRITKGHTEPEVYWVIINEFGGISTMAARNIRKTTKISGFSFQPGVWEQIDEILIEAANNNN